MKKEITIKQKSVYGKILLYPGCDQSAKFAKLIQKQTFSNYDLTIIESLGYTINCISL
jgi:hypothetical protein